MQRLDLKPSDHKYPAQEVLQTALDVALEFIAGERDSQPPRWLEAGELRELLDLRLRPTGRPLDEVVANLRQILAVTPSSADPRFFNQLYGGRDLVSTMAEMVAAAADTQLHTFKVAGPHALVEDEVLGRMARMVGYADGEGTFASGASMANMMAMIVARNEAVPGSIDDGLTAGPGTPLRVYTSAEGHYSIAKNMSFLGFGRRNLRQIPVDGVGRMDVSALARTVAADIADGAVPVMINATAGTTVGGAFDPLRQIAEVAAEHGVWLHVDGAYGGSVLLADAHRHLADGSELADSFTWNAHKMMGTPLVCSAFLVRRRGLLRQHFSHSADYLFQDHKDLDPGTRSLQCGRRNDALKVWCAWQYYGDEGYDERICRMFTLARHARDLVVTDPELLLSQEPESINVCFEVVGRSSVEICERLYRQGRRMVGHGVVGGRRVIRLVCVNPDFTEADIEAFFREVKAAAAGLGAGDNAV